MSIDQDFVFANNGLNRTYKLYRPKNLPDNAPMVFLLHGMTSSSNWTYITGFNELAEKHGFLAVYPQSHLTRSRIEQDSYKNITDDKLASMRDWLKTVSEKTASCKDGEKFSLMGTDFTREDGAAVTFTNKWNNTDEDNLFDGKKKCCLSYLISQASSERISLEARKNFCRSIL